MALISTDLEQAVMHLRRGELVAIPTETVYGLAADACNPAAVAHIFKVKGRPKNHPIIVHLASQQQLPIWADSIPDSAYRLAEAFWPGPLTLVLQRHPQIPATVSAGQATIGLRCPSHPLAQALLEQFGGGLAAPSANRFGRISPTQASHVLADLGDAIPLILDGGDCSVGLESTIIGLHSGKAELLRPGGISVDAIEQVLACTLTHHQDAAAAGQQVPGLLAKHYAPHTPLISAPLATLIRIAEQSQAKPIGLFHLTPLAHALPHLVCQQMPNEPQEFAQQLYATLRHHDQRNYALLLFEAPPQHTAWLAINDRLRRASQQWLVTP